MLEFLALLLVAVMAYFAGYFNGVDAEWIRQFDKRQREREERNDRR